MRTLILGLALALPPILAHAATMQVEQHDGKTRLVIEGDINVGDGDRFLERVASARPTELEMNSPGGDADSGMAIARWVYENQQISVVVEDYCNSACSYAALVALGRGDLAVNASSSVGVHQVRDGDDDRPGKANVAWTKRAADTLRGYGAPEEPLVAMVATPPSGITAFDAAALERMGATVARAALPDLLPDWPDLPKIPVPGLPAAPHAAAPVDIGALAILILLLFGLALTFRRLAPATNKERTMKFYKQMRRDQARGYEVNYTQLRLAYVIEAGIILACFYAAYEFAQRYVSDDWTLWTMAIIGGLAVALAETARIQLAKTTRTQKGAWMKFWAIVGVIFMCMITVKSMSQVLDQVFSPRLRQVQAATDDVKLSEGELNMLKTRRNSANEIMKPLTESVERLDGQIADLNRSLQQIGEAPEAHVEKVPYKSTCSNGKSGKRRKTWSCTRTREKWVTPDYEGRPVIAQIEDARLKRQEAAAKRDAAARQVSGVDEQIARQETKVAGEKGKLREAVGMSQLHSFTAMIFGKAPNEVSDAEIHWFLRLFVFLPSIAIAIASSLLAVTAYRATEPRTTKAEAIEIDRSKTLQRHLQTLVDDRIRAHGRKEPDNIVHPDFKEQGR